jgi:hypothetical protein
MEQDVCILLVPNVQNLNNALRPAASYRLLPKDVCTFLLGQARWHKLGAFDNV